MLKEHIKNTEELKKIYSILEDLEALHSKLHNSLLYDLISRDFWAIMELFYREREQLERRNYLIIRKIGRLNIKRERI